MKVEYRVKKTQKGTLEIVLTDQDIYNLLEEKGVFLDLADGVLQSSEFIVERVTRFAGAVDVDRDSPIICTLSWEFEE